MNPFDRIIGYEQVKNELRQIIDMFKNREVYAQMGARLTKGILIYGPSGIGKTMLAEALIEECGVKSYVVRKNKNDVDSVKEICEIFDDAAKQEAAIILLDDMDKFSDQSDDNSDDMAFSSIQAGIDSIKDSNVLVIATVNNLRKLPFSLTRSGRFDRKIGLQTPCESDARKIIEYYMKSKRVAADLNYEDVAKMISYKSCADLEAILNESAVYAAYGRKYAIDIDDIKRAYLRTYYNSSDEDFECSKDDLVMTALHEAGHAAIAEILSPGSVGFVSIQSKEGFTHVCRPFTRRGEHVLVGLGGKAAAELFHNGRCGSGCQSDLAKVARLIRDGVSESGTCGTGVLKVSSSEFPNASDNLTMRNEAVVQAELERNLFTAKEMLAQNRGFLQKLSDALIEKKTLLYSEIRSIRDSVEINRGPF